MTWFKVEVIWSDDYIQDEIKGTNERDALINAAYNWEDAVEIRLI